jgi:hypothetical protein
MSRELRILVIRKQKRADFIQTFSSAHGERVLQDLVRFSKLFKPDAPLTEGDLAYQAGMQRVVLRILNIMGRSPEQMTKAIEHYLQTEEESYG